MRTVEKLCQSIIAERLVEPVPLYKSFGSGTRSFFGGGGGGIRSAVIGGGELVVVLWGGGITDSSCWGNYFPFDRREGSETVYLDLYPRALQLQVSGF